MVNLGSTFNIGGVTALSVWVDHVLEHSPVEAAVMAANAVGR